MSHPSRRSLYRRLLGTTFDAMPAALRELHDQPMSAAFAGEAEVIAAENIIARLIARISGLPTRSYPCPVEVRIDIDADVETWHRDFGGHRFHSRMHDDAGSLIERLGPHTIRFRLHADAEGLSMQPIAWRTLGIPLPRLLWPKLSAREYQIDGRFHFDVATAFPIIGRVVHYRGWLMLRAA